MKDALERIIKIKNPHFKFDKEVQMVTLVSLAWDKLRMLLRGKWHQLFGLKAKKPFIGKGVKIRNRYNMKLGDMVNIDDYAYLNALGKGKLTIGNYSSIGAYSRIEISQTYQDLGHFISIGNNVGIGAFSMLGGAGGLRIGNDCIIGQYFSCHPENHIFSDVSKSIRLQGVKRKGIDIGPNCWIGSKVTILDGVKIGSGCVIAAGAVVTKSFEENSIIGGIPAKCIGYRVEEEIFS